MVDALRLQGCQLAGTVLKYVSAVAAFFKKSDDFGQKLKEACGKGLVVHAPTRWNSYIDILERYSDVSNNSIY